MENFVLSEIVNWFSHQCDGEFSLPDRSHPFEVIGPPAGAHRIVYVTKTSIVHHVFEMSPDPAKFGIISRCGLPNETDAHWIRDLVGFRELLFIGDLDPPDLLIFAWLRASLHPLKVTHLGLSDRYMKLLNVVVPENYRIQLSQSEEAARPLLRHVFPDLAEAIGPQCENILDQRQKIEMEAVVSALGSPESFLLPVNS